MNFAHTNHLIYLYLYLCTRKIGAHQTNKKRHSYCSVEYNVRQLKRPTLFYVASTIEKRATIETRPRVLYESIAIHVRDYNSKTINSSRHNYKRKSREIFTHRNRLNEILNWQSQLKEAFLCLCCSIAHRYLITSFRFGKRYLPFLWNVAFRSN